MADTTYQLRLRSYVLSQMCLFLQKEMGAKSTSASEVREEREERHAVSSFVKKHKKEYGIGVLFIIFM